MNNVFRLWYARLTQVHTLLPSDTPFVALTPTATKSVKERIVKVLYMTPPVSIYLSPNWDNIHYAVQSVNLRTACSLLKKYIFQQAAIFHLRSVWLITTSSKWLFIHDSWV